MVAADWLARFRKLLTIVAGSVNDWNGFLPCGKLFALFDDVIRDGRNVAKAIVWRVC